MRIWDVQPNKLCRQHLLGEHRELHAIWAIITENKKGYSKHPETRRWHNKLAALYKRHTLLVNEMARRGYCHHSPLNKKQARGSTIQRIYIDSPRRQAVLLRQKKCPCLLS